MSEQNLEPQTAATSPDDAELQGWLAEQQQNETEAIRQALSPPAEPSQARSAQARTGARLATEPIEPYPRPTGGTSGTTSPARPLASFYAYVNSRPDKDWNTCGQAAVASMLDFNGRDLQLPRKGDGTGTTGRRSTR